MDAERDTVSKDYKKIKDKTNNHKHPNRKSREKGFTPVVHGWWGREKGWKARVLLVAKETGT